MPASLATPKLRITLNASVADADAFDIIACRLAPNARLRVETLRQRYGMARALFAKR